MEEKIYDMIVIGGGPAGYTAALYAARSGLSVLVLEKLSAGGQMTNTDQIDNYPGFPEGIGGFELGERMQKSALRFGADIRSGIATAADLGAAPYKITIDGERVIETETLIIATGASAKYLGLADEQKWKDVALQRVWPKVADGMGGKEAINAFLKACGSEKVLEILRRY